jgi:NTE family protein
MSSSLKIGLALGSGGPRGIAHIGVLKVFEKYQIPIDFIAGSSMGAVVGGLYATGKSAAELEELILKNNWQQLLPLLFDPKFSGGLLSGKKTYAFLKQFYQDVEFSDLKIPFCAVGTDLDSGRPVVMNKGKVMDAVIASMCVPPVFEPTKYHGLDIIDGGASMPVPVSAVKQMGASITIGVNVHLYNLDNNSAENKSISKVLSKTIEIMLYNLSRNDLQKADIQIEPAVGGVGWHDLLTQKGSQKAIEIGVEATEKNIKYIKELVCLPQRNWFRQLLQFWNNR